VSSLPVEVKSLLRSRRDNQGRKTIFTILISVSRKKKSPHGPIVQKGEEGGEVLLIRGEKRVREKKKDSLSSGERKARLPTSGEKNGKKKGDKVKQSPRHEGEGGKIFFSSRIERKKPRPTEKGGGGKRGGGRPKSENGGRPKEKKDLPLIFARKKKPPVVVVGKQKKRKKPPPESLPRRRRKDERNLGEKRESGFGQKKKKKKKVRPLER